MVKFQALSSWRFQRGFDRVNLHRPTTAPAALPAVVDATRELNPPHGKSPGLDA